MLNALITWASKSKTSSTSKGHSSPHLHVPSFRRYSLSSSIDFSSIPLGLKGKQEFHWWLVGAEAHATVIEYRSNSQRMYSGTNTRYKTNFALIQPLLNYGKILKHDLRCSVSFQVDIFAPASKDLVILFWWGKFVSKKWQSRDKKRLFSCMCT